MSSKRFSLIINVATALIIMLIMSVAVEQVFVYFQLSRKIGFNTSEILKSVLPVFIGVLGFFALFLNPKVNEFLGEVHLEVTKVTWPGQKEIQLSTISVIILVVIIGFMLGIFDFLVVKLVNYIL